ncbi:MAG TPA: S41 family peptidase [Steroidobacteraceae bacterium]|jgi:carboxyl-terminal processing protease
MKPNPALLAILALATSSSIAQSAAETRAEVFDAVVKTVTEQFYDPAFHGVDWVGVQTRYRARLGEVKDDAGLQRLMTQMLEELKSSHLYVYRTTSGSAGAGLAARIEPLEGADTVLELAPLSDARAQGLRPGDRIVGGIASLKGPAGTFAEVSVQRCDGTTSQLKIRRENWLFPEEHPGWRWARIRVAPEKVIGYIRVDRFDDGAAQLADQALDELSGTQALVIDVRTNSGGNISAMRLASYFIERRDATFALMSRPYLQKLGRPVQPGDVAAAPKVIGRYRGEDVGEALAKGGGAAAFSIEDLGAKRYHAPVVVLIGPGTGSAAEGFAWGMKTWSHARLIGAATAGAILSGENFDVAPGWSLTVPTAGHWSAAGEDLNDKPVTPHELAPQTRADLCAGRDRGFERAIAILTAGA